MKKVYIVLGQYGQERSELIGVYADLDQAQQKMREVFDSELKNFNVDSEFYYRWNNCSARDWENNYVEFKIVSDYIQ